MPKWIPFTPEELQRLAAQQLTLSEAHLMTCPHCSLSSVRLYIHDLPVNSRKTAEWLWCSACKRYTHHTVGTLSHAYQYNDPLLEKEEHKNKDLFSGDKWYDFLEDLYKRGELPQVITIRKQPDKTRGSNN